MEKEVVSIGEMCDVNELRIQVKFSSYLFSYL